MESPHHSENAESPSNSPKAEVDAIPPALEVALELSSVKFESYEPADVFRVQLSTTGNSLPISIWMEAKRSKLQWKCDVQDFANHAPADAKYVLPVSTVLAALQAALTAKTKHKLDGENSKDKSLQIDMFKDGSELRLSLEIEALFGMHARYEFTLKQVEVQRIDILEAKLRDLTEQIEVLAKEKNNQLKKIEEIKVMAIDKAKLNELSEQVKHLVAEMPKLENLTKVVEALVLRKPQLDTMVCTRFLSEMTTTDEEAVVWKSSMWNCSTPFANYFVVANGGSSITIVNNGLYQIDCYGKPNDAKAVIILHVNGTKTASSTSDAGGLFVQISRKLPLVANSTLQLRLSAPDCNHTDCGNRKCRHVFLAAETELWITFMMH
ncbi:hypothetical protein LEN26_019246 [Aphanomyces euteiches]|nr:hypothetical protein LEN26_019246 [Aphanomyces euteiches]